MLKKIFIFVLGWKLLVLLFAYFAILIFPLNSTFTLPYRYRFVYNRPTFIESKFPYFLWIWGNFDGYYYTSIAQRGYFLNEQPFFPFYPLLIKLVTMISHIPYLISALIISNSALILSLIVIRKILLLDKKESLLNIMYAVILLFPTSFFYGAAYNDALFLLFATLTIYFARTQSWVWASFIGALATLTRLNGLALMFVIFFEYMFSKESSLAQNWEFKVFMGKIKNMFKLRNIITSKIYSIVLIPTAFLGYLFYTKITYGSWHLVFSAMKQWGQDKITFPPQVFWRYFKIITVHPNFNLIYWIAVTEVVFVLFYIFLMIYAYRKIRFSYWIFFVISILIPSLTGTFQGMPRYGLHLYSFFLSLTLFLGRKGKLFKWIYFAVSTLLLFLYVSLFTRGYFVA